MTQIIIVRRSVPWLKVFLLALGLIFIVLKLAQVGDIVGWPWWVVTSPIWVIPAVIIVKYLLLLIFWIFGAAAKIVTRNSRLEKMYDPD